MSLLLREICQDDNVNNLSLGDQSYKPLKYFLKKQAKEFHNNNLAKTYVLIDGTKPSRVMGYISLVCSEIILVNHQRPMGGEPYKNFPAIKIVRLALDRKIQKNGIGLNLIKWTIGIVKIYVMPRVGCRFLIVDSKPQAIKFYERAGFILLDTKENREENKNPLMLLDLHISLFH